MIYSLIGLGFIIAFLFIGGFFGVEFPKVGIIKWILRGAVVLGGVFCIYLFFSYIGHIITKI